MSQPAAAHASITPSLGPLRVAYDGTIPVLAIPDDLPFAELRDWIRERMPAAQEAVGGRASRLDLGNREIQLFDLRRLIHVLRDEYSVDVTGIYVQSAAVQRYAERELKLKLFLRGAPAVPEAARKPTAEATQLWGERRTSAATEPKEDPELTDPGTEICDEATAESSGPPPPRHGVASESPLPGLADLLSVLGGAEAPDRTEPDVELFEPATALRRPIPLPDLPKEEPEIDADGGRRSLTIRRTLRSGSAIRFEGDVNVMGDVNAGAQVKASGNIVVMGRLRGVVHAGANGDDTAFILAFDLSPTQLRVARHIAIAPDTAARGDVFFPEIATVLDGQVVVEPWKGRFRR